MNRPTILVMVAILISTSMAVAGAADPEAPFVVTDPVVPRDFTLSLELTDEVQPPPAHPPMDQIPPAPMPAGAGPTPVRSPNGIEFTSDTTSYNAITGEVRQGSERDRVVLNSPGLQPGIPGLPDPTSDEAGLKTYSNLSVVGNTSIFPYRANTKLVMRFQDTSGVSHFFNCSGTMIDPEVVLTAAHCIYQHAPDGLIINDWAREVWAYPGWDGVGVQWSSPSGTVINPYGYARGTYFIAGTNFINLTDPDNADVGAVEVTRAVGTLTGTFGYAWDWDCATWMLSQTSYNMAYPAEGCGTPGLHTGRDMYFWSGTMDWCDPNGVGWGNQLFLDTTGGCFNAGWGGMSGSSVYFFHDGNRLAHAVTSRSDRDTWVSYARIWSTFASDLGGSFVSGARGASFDLQALDFSGPATATAGDAITTASFLATNPTNGSANTSYPLDLYLSTNSNISSSDTHLGSTSFSWSYTAMSSVTVTIGSLTIPLNTPTGAYYLGTVLATSVDGNPGNNDTDEWDAHPISIAGIWDMAALSVNAPSGTFDIGDAIAVSFNVTNRGGDSSPPVYITLYASTNTIISDGDHELYSEYHASVAGGATISGTESITLPASLPRGTYYIGVEISPLTDYTSSNNDTYDATPIQFLGGLIFENGFESGGTTFWSSTTP